MINYEHLNKGADIINEFRDKLVELCNEYQEKLERECPEDISMSVMSIADYHIWIQLSDNFFDEPDGKAYTEEELISDGFEFDHEIHGTPYYTKSINGVEVTCSIHK